MRALTHSFESREALSDQICSADHSEEVARSWEMGELVWRLRHMSVLKDPVQSLGCGSLNSGRHYIAD